MTPRREKLVQRCLAGVLVVGLIVLVIIGHEARQSAATTHATRDATAAARTALPQILSYTDATLSNQLASSRRLMTPAYAKRYAPMVRSRVWPQAKKFGVANQLGVVSIGTIRATPRATVLLVFANQTTRTKERPDGVTQGTRLMVTMRHQGDRWLVDDLKPL